MSYAAGLAARRRLAGGRRELDLGREGYLSRAGIEVLGDLGELGRATVDSARAWRRGIRVAADIARARNFGRHAHHDDVEVGLLPGYASMGETRRAMDLLDGEIKATSSEMFLRKVTDPAMREADPDFTAFYLGPWGDFVGRWSTFYDANKGRWPRFVDTNDIYNRTQQFRKEFISFRDQAEALGFEWRSPAPLAPDGEKHGLLGAGSKALDRSLTGIEALLWSIVKFSLIGGAIFLAFIFAHQKLRT